MTAILSFEELLRDSVRKKMGTLPSLTEEDFNSEVERILNNFKDDVTSNVQLFDFSKLRIEDIRTVNNFLRSPYSKKNKTYDFFSIFVGYKGWQDFRNNYLKNTSSLCDNTKSSESTKISLAQEPEIPGATVIGPRFINEVKAGMEFSRAEFYTAKQNENCQWYGIYYGFDVQRDDYEGIKKIALDAFEKPRTYKVAAVVFGAGGSGKSTLLRKIALAAQKSMSFQVVWLNDNSFLDFIGAGIETIKKQNHIQFLIFIEDWYRMVSSEVVARAFLEKTNSIDNIRVIIGDRTITGKAYMNYLIDSDHSVFHLTPDENKKIIDQIIRGHAPWRSVAQKLFVHPNSYQSTLYLLLFIIARASENDFIPADFDLSEPTTAFRSIIKSDMRVVAGKYEGVAIALQYWAAIYSEEKMFIAYDTFLNIADSFGNGENASADLKQLRGNSPVHEKLRIYIHTSEDRKMFFNHDILADTGLSKINLEPIDDIARMKLLTTIIDTGDKEAASRFLSAMLHNYQHLFSDRKDMLEYIEQLIDNGNDHDAYLFSLIQLKLTEDELTYFDKKIKEKGINFDLIWLNLSID